MIKKHFKLIAFTIKMITQLNKKLFFLVTLLALVGGVTPIISLMITQNILNSIQSMSLPFDEIVGLVIIYCVFSISVMIVQNINAYISEQLNIFLIYRMKFVLMEKCSELPLESLEETDTYDMITRLENEIAVKPSQALSALVGIASISITLVTALVILFRWQIWMFLIFIIISLISLISHLKVANKEFQMRFNRSNKEREVWYYAFLLTRDTAFKEVKILNLKDYFLKKYWELVKLFIKEENQLNRFSILLQVMLSFLQDLMAGFVMFIAIREAYLGFILIGTALVYMNVTNMIQGAIGGLATHIHSLYNSNLYMSLLKDFLKLETQSQLGEYEVKEINSLKVSNVSYDYPNQKNVLKDVSFELFKGERVAIVGENGSGKSTLLKLLCGLYKPSSGDISINGQAFRNVNMESYKKNISVLFQDFLKLESSLLENIHIGHIDEEVDQEQVKEALDFAGVDFFKEGENYDYHRFLGNWFEDGSQVSGGQWQKIALARAYYKEAQLYFLDEPSSALDVLAEMKIFESFFEKSRHKLGVFITHRIKIAKQADKIIVMSKGEIVDVGDHDYLYQQCSLYRALLEKEEELNILKKEEGLE